MEATAGRFGVWSPRVALWTILASLLFQTAAPGQTTTWDTWSDTWVATDALGRSLPGHADCGPPRGDRYVGIFYFLWHGQHGTSGPHNITQILAQYPDALSLSTSPPWGPLYAFHHWGESDFGYYLSDDPYVIRRHCDMLTDAGIDTLIFDVTNQFTYTSNYMLLCSIYRQIRQSGRTTPQVCFFGRVTTLQVLYDEFYSHNLYPELWFQWKGKPLFLLSKAFPEDPEPSEALKSFFTIRSTWAWSSAGWFGDGHDRWTWADTYPQRYGWHTPGVPEELSVAIAMQETYMSAPTAHGRHYHNRAEPPPGQWTGQGDHFAEQWQRALAVDPEFVFITGWNEWVAQRFVSDGSYVPAGYSFFVDQFLQEYSRDIEPMKGGHTDNYYYQTVNYVRQFKGVRPSLAVSPPHTISIDGAFGDWTGVEPEFRDSMGDTTHRNHLGWGSAGTYTDATGRNDIRSLKVAHDADYICFYAQTNQSLTSWNGSRWMLLFIDADCDATTGWEGYDCLVNSPVIDQHLTSLKARTPEGAWTTAAQVSYAVAGNQLELRIPREAIGQGGKLDVALDFHWADNIQTLDDIVEFSAHGDSAPNGRFKYRYVADYTAPAAVSGFAGSPDGDQINLAWTNPPDHDFRRTVIRYGTDAYPVSPTDGLAVCDQQGAPGSQAASAHTGLARGTTYHYSAFACDDVPNWSAAATLQVFLPVKGDFDRDGDVDQADFGRFQACMSGWGIVQHDPACADAILDGDHDVSPADFSIFWRCLSGPGQPADPDCAD